MLNESRTVFEPTLGVSEWSAVVLPLLLVLLVILLGVRLSLRFRHQDSPGLSRFALLGSSVIASALLSVAYSGRDRLATVSFTDTHVEIAGPLRNEVMVLTPTNVARANDSIVELRSGGKVIRFPASGTWQIDNLTVDAKCLATEFAGRSRHAGQLSASR